MTTVIRLLVLCTGIVGALGQTIDFNNTRTFATTADRFVYDGGTATRLVGTEWVAQLYYRIGSMSSLTPVTSNPTTFRNVPSSDPQAGTWIGATRTLSGASPGETAILQVRVWDTTSGSTFDAALRRGLSQTFTYVVPAPGSPPAAFYMENFRSFTVAVPEPSAVGLALLGAFAIFMLKRRASKLERF